MSIEPLIIYNMNKEVITFRVRASEKKRLTAIAKNRRVSLSRYIKTILIKDPLNL